MNNILYTVTSSKACAEAIDWLNKNNIPFKERRISKANPLKYSEIQHMLKISGNGFEDIVKRNKKISKINGEMINLEDLSTNKLILTIIGYPNIIRTPIIIDDKKMVVGFQISEMGIFIPRTKRKNDLENLLKNKTGIEA